MAKIDQQVLISSCAHNQSLICSGKDTRLVRCPRCDWWVSPRDPSYKLALLECNQNAAPENQSRQEI